MDDKKKYVGNMKKYVENIKKYVENMKKNIGIIEKHRVAPLKMPVGLENILSSPPIYRLL